MKKSKAKKNSSMAYAHESYRTDRRATRRDAPTTKGEEKTASKTPATKLNNVCQSAIGFLFTFWAHRAHRKLGTDRRYFSLCARLYLHLRRVYAVRQSVPVDHFRFFFLLSLSLTLFNQLTIFFYLSVIVVVVVVIII